MLQLIKNIFDFSAGWCVEWAQQVVKSNYFSTTFHEAVGGCQNFTATASKQPQFPPEFKHWASTRRTGRANETKPLPFGGIQTKTKISFYSWSLIYLNLLRDNFNYVLFSGVIKLTFDWFSGCLLSIHWDRGHHLRIDITRQVYNQFQTIGPLIKGAGGECKVPLLPPLRNHSCREYNFFGRTRNFWLTMKPQIESIRSTQYGWCG